MASVAISASRAALRPIPLAARVHANPTQISRLVLPRQSIRQQFRRGYASSPRPLRPSKQSISWGLAVLGASSIGGWYLSGRPSVPVPTSKNGQAVRTEEQKEAVVMPEKKDYQEVYNAIAQRFVDEDDYDDGSYGPVVLRLGWHASGT
jgi:cytochrome c peroxidase